MRELRNFDDALREDLKDPLEARAYLEVAFELYEEDKNTEMLLMALRDVVEAQGDITPLSQRTHLNQQILYRALSGRVNLRVTTLGTILRGLGFKITIQTLNNSNHH